MDCVPIIKYPWILHPPMQEFVKKNIIKLLDVGVVYPIINSKWVSSVQHVPKKVRITVVTVEKNELIPISPVT